MMEKIADGNLIQILSRIQGRRVVSITREVDSDAHGQNSINMVFDDLAILSLVGWGFSAPSGLSAYYAPGSISSTETFQALAVGMAPNQNPGEFVRFKLEDGGRISIPAQRVMELYNESVRRKRQDAQKDTQK